MSERRQQQTGVSPKNKIKQGQNNTKQMYFKLQELKATEHEFQNVYE